MTTSTPLKLRHLRTLLCAKPQQEIVRLYLHQDQDDLLKDAVLVTLHSKWSSRPPYALTEIGITTYDRARVNRGMPCPPGAHAEDLLEHVWCMHLRICSSGHLPSAEACPDSFHFGTSVFVTYEQAQDMLHQIWHQPMDDAHPSKSFRPIICLTYGENDPLGKIRKVDPDFVPLTTDTTIAVVNAQYTAVQAKITSRQDASVEYVLPIFKMLPFHHNNAGNAALYITVIAFLSALRYDLYQSEANPRARPGQKGISSTKSAQSVMQSLMERPTPAPPFGVTVYCCRCSSYLHVAEDCPYTYILCGKCETSKAEWRRDNATSHVEGLCVFNEDSRRM